MRADAVRNRAKLVAAPAELFGARGLDVPLEHVAERAGVGIATLYAHFPGRADLLNAVVPDRLARTDHLVERALSTEDPWAAFAGFLEGLFAMQADDPVLRDALANRVALSDEIAEICHRCHRASLAIVARAQDAGALRPDFGPADLAALTTAVSQVLREAPDSWRRLLGYVLDGLRTGDG
ncbi:TetR/AcrR family transcriptional regulator [Actinokineospora pegani]|uniref:TetR/AcrR family transcriptional regulator n=1 Tax=Actinokineospora pegani TaxID=2654637 RepID=UPI0012EA9A1F|nr:TetR/AcrR family transcriptional regulator [Actinokineospora pegani]